MLPLRTNGYARGVVGRLNGKGVAVGFFFGPRLESLAEATIDEGLQPERTVLIARFGDLGLLKGAWVVIGHIGQWDRERWRVPGFLHLDEGGDQGFVRYYDDSLAFVKEDRVVLSAISPNVPRDGLLGYGAAEIRLTKILAPKS